MGGFFNGGAIAIRFVSEYNTTQVSKLALFGAAAPIWTNGMIFHILCDSAVDDLINLNNTDRPQLLADFAKIFSAKKIL